ncbi:MAG: translation elongation factor Ts [Oscillospiraceae bacterium]|jgi:elongation factor Ts|nr:translation elongation factor Ts [Oscillospiraceae bacterium]
MAISAQEVKQLKELTNCGMMDCKRALEETNGDMDAAIKYLREKGLAKATKKAGRIAAEGLVFTKIDRDKKIGTVVEVNSETDFAAKSERFVQFVEQVADTILNNDISDVEALKGCTAFGGEETLNEALIEKIATIGENIQIRRFAKLNGDLFTYVHDGGGSIIGTILKLEADDAGDPAVAECAKNLLLQITASGPQYVSKDDVPAQVIEDEKDTQMGIVKTENEAKPKPQNVLEKIVEGRLRKFLEEICLLDQPYVKDPDLTVAKYIESVGKNIKIIQFVRYEKGEGIQKKEDNFADEVASMINN